MKNKNTYIIIGLAIVGFYAYRHYQKKNADAKKSLNEGQKKEISKIIDFMKVGRLK